MGEERRLVTVLFADIVGSTSLADEHDPELVRATLQSAFAICRDIVSEHGGTVEKFIGDEVMAVFGVPEAHEDDAERAVRAAFAIRTAMTERNARSRLALRMRYGISSGEVVSGAPSGEVMVTGRPVNVGARVRAAAAPDEILVGPNARELTLTAVRYGAPRTIDAKGIGEMQVWPAEGLVNDKPIRVLARQAPIVGRDEELQLVRALERRMHDSQKPFLVTIFGPAGIGKSRFAAEFIDGIGVERVRIGHCLPYGQASALWPLREIMQADARIAADDTRDEALKKLRLRIRSVFADGSEDPGAISRRLGVLAGLLTVDEALPDVQSANLASELRLALRRYLERRTRGKPLVLVFEDLHWADPALLDTIDHLAEWATAPLLLVCLARPELLDTRPSWGAGRTNATALTLSPLTYGDAHRLVEGLVPKHALPTVVREEIVRRSEGNPLYVEEFVRMLHELEETGPKSGGGVDLAEFVRIALPATLHGLVSSRLGRLTPDVRDALRRAAVFGERFSPVALRELEAAPLDVDAALAYAQQRDLVDPIREAVLGGGQGYRFRHALIREVSYREMSKSDRWRMHDAAGRWIETASADRAAEHEDQVAYHAEQAFWNARELEAHETETLGLRAFERLMTAATNWRRAGLLRASLGLYDRAERLGTAAGVAPKRVVEARGFGALVRCYVEGARKSLTKLDAALAEARGAGPSEVLVRLASQRAFMARVESLEESGALFAEGIAAAQSTGDPELIAHATLMSNAQAWMRGDLEEHFRVLQDADAVMVDSGHVAERGVALAWLATNALQRGDFRGALTYLSASERNAEQSGSVFQMWASYRAAARDALAMGDADRALALAEKSLELARQVGARRLIGLSCARLGDVLYERAEYAKSRAVLEEGLRILDPETMSETIVETHWKLSRTCLAVGDIPSARTFARAAAANVAPTDRYSKVTTTAALAAVESAEGNASEAESHYREALEAVGITGYRALRADLERSFGEFLLRQGRTEDARVLLLSARIFYANEATDRRRADLDALLARCGPLTPTVQTAGK